MIESANAAYRLPTEVASFIGRTTELDDLTALLATTRLLTVTGAGGSGKTRVALRLARAVAPRFPDGVTLVTFASISESRLVTRAAGTALGVHGSAGTPLIATLATAIGSRRMLIVLDNCEHLVGACAALADTLLGACPRLQIVATSREPLRVAGEVTFRLAPFDPPAPSSVPSSIAANDAVTLFVERARAREPRFELAPETAHDIAAICRRVAGIPLAIELAAARVGTLSVRQIAERIDDSLGVLGRGSRTDARQETLRGTLDWSHDLLTEAEQTLFRRLSVFAGVFDLDAVVETAGGQGIRNEDVLDLLSALVEKSLVEAEVRADSFQYRLLEPIRQYASERLDGAGEREDIRRRHARHYVNLVETAEPIIRSGERPPWMARLATAENNIRSVLAWSRRASEPTERELGLRLAGSLAWYWVFRGQIGEGLDWVGAALASSAEAGAAIRGRALFGAAELAWHAGQAERARGYIDESEALLRDVGDKRALAYALQSLPMTIDNPRSEEAVAESRHLFEELGDAWGAAMTLSAPDLFALVGGGDPTGEGRARLEEALGRWRTVRDPWGMAMALNMLGDLERSQGKDAAAASRYEEALALLREQNLTGTVPSLLHNLGHVALRARETRRALNLFRESLSLFRGQGDQRGIADALDGVAGVLVAMHQPGQAARLVGTAEYLRASIGAGVWPANISDRDRILDEIESQIGADEFRAARDDGRLEPVERIVADILADRSTDQTTGSDPLTQRERDVAALVARGLTNRQIGAELFITEGTVKLHVKHILQKLDMVSRAQIAAWVAEHESQHRHPTATTG